MTFYFVCGGTAGHVNPAITIAAELRERIPKAVIIFAGTGRDIEKKLIPEAGFELISFNMSGVRRGFTPSAVLHNIKTLFRVVLTGSKAKKMLRKTKPAAVIGTGGYICYPIMKAAATLGIPTFLHESNACPGMSVRMLSAVVDKVMITYHGYEQYYRCPERLVYTGTPISKEFTRMDDVKEERNKPLVVSFWGSLGAEKMNEIMAGFIAINYRTREFYHIHAAGNSLNKLYDTLDRYSVYDTQPPHADVREYITDMPAVMNNADLILCRGGGITMAELTAVGKPAIIIPSPYVPDDTQYKNAKQLTQIGAAILLSESECTAETLYNTVSKLTKNKQKLEAMSKASKSLAKPDATRDIADLILNTVSDR